MLTTKDLYTKPGYGIDIDSVVKFKLLRGLELKTIELFKSRVIGKSKNPNSNRTVALTITDYKPYKSGDLEIEGVMSDGYNIMLRLSQCRDLKIFE